MKDVSTHLVVQRIEDELAQLHKHNLHISRLACRCCHMLVYIKSLQDPLELGSCKRFQVRTSGSAVLSSSSVTGASLFRQEHRENACSVLIFVTEPWEPWNQTDTPSYQAGQLSIHTLQSAIVGNIVQQLLKLV